MTEFDATQTHRRRNALTGEWVMVSPQRALRPWQGEQGGDDAPGGPSYEPSCYLCPGNARADGAMNPNYAGPWAFDNDFPAVLPRDELERAGGHPGALQGGDGLFSSAPVSGRCRVLCYSPDHNKTLSQLSEAEIAAVVALWAEEVRGLRRGHHWVQVFENRGAMMGCSNPHPHGQVWAVDSLPSEAAKEALHQDHWWATHQTVLLDVYREREEERGERLVATNADWSVVVPYWAAWPYETLLIPKRQIDHLDNVARDEQASLASILKTLLLAYDRLFETTCPYTLGWHGAPGQNPAPAWQLHAHCYPPLLRSATIRKHMVGYEMLAEAQRDLTPEVAAAALRRAVAVNSSRA